MPGLVNTAQAELFHTYQDGVDSPTLTGGSTRLPIPLHQDGGPLETLVDAYLHHEPLVGLPENIAVDGVKKKFGPFITARRAAIRYCLSVGLSPTAFPRTYLKVDKTQATLVAQLYEEMTPTPDDALTQAAYRALANESLAQWQIIKATGLHVEFSPTSRGEPDPYSNPRRLIQDVVENNHLFVTESRSAYGSESFKPDDSNPMLDQVPHERISGQVPLVNDIFRIVHDYFGHVREGLGFRAEGEYNTWRGHSVMYSPLARRAMTMELLVQNYWINYGPYGELNRNANVYETRYPRQRLGLLPEWVCE
ncbi:hypothetical protein C2857_003892 [Epichloe festucae Fl1]|uniref:Uncharacterized protein n=1 Tax=Epichloe festucae (strain Fl1) TaxID=877507 RepID=A0A7S9PU53_EPIFF|nr:hypothetical protein C2857_003892 [Epichloe festucae Fl1]